MPLTQTTKLELNMADTNLKPGTTIAKTQSNFLQEIQKNTKLHAKITISACLKKQNPKH
jgi:hypothetical protein